MSYGNLGGQYVGNLDADLVTFPIMVKLFPDKKLKISDFLHFTDSFSLLLASLWVLFSHRLHVLFSVLHQMSSNTYSISQHAVQGIDSCQTFFVHLLFSNYGEEHVSQNVFSASNQKLLNQTFEALVNTILPNQPISQNLHNLPSSFLYWPTVMPLSFLPIDFCLDCPLLIQMPGILLGPE